jgi:hypothetical protein
LELTAEERALLRAILTLANEVTEVIAPEASEVTGPEGETSFSAEFAAAFTSSKAELISAYAHAPRPGTMGQGPSMIGQGPGMVGRAVWASPAMVGRMVGKSTTSHTGAHHDHPHDGSG